MNVPYSKITDMFSNEAKFQSEMDLVHLFIPKEDVFIAWLEKIDLKNDHMRVVTMSLPNYGTISQEIKEVVDNYKNITKKIIDAKKSGNMKIAEDLQQVRGHPETTLTSKGRGVTQMSTIVSLLM